MNEWYMLLCTAGGRQYLVIKIPLINIFAQFIMHINENGHTSTPDISLLQFIVNFHIKRILKVTWQHHLLDKIHSRPIEDRSHILTQWFCSRHSPQQLSYWIQPPECWQSLGVVLSLGKWGDLYLFQRTNDRKKKPQFLWRQVLFSLRFLLCSNCQLWGERPKLYARRLWLPGLVLTDCSCRKWVK